MRNWLIYTLIGFVLLIGGIVALANPFAATIAATQIVGIVFLLAGLIQMITVMRGGPDSHRWLNGFVGILFLLAGLSILINPLVGAAWMTLLLGLLFVVMGGMRLLLSFTFRDTNLFWLLLLTGAASILIGALIFSNFFAAATTLLGLLVGLELVLDGIGLMAFGIAARRPRHVETPA
ncbi:hypothetical protein BV509_03600 [Rhodovulum sulfidophilum]|uniref:DUF308 domain-containing protein n=1 Tax=Rhodovulum visakhapatnamense TaxID=364297 RepID=A0A4R8FG77_9RHOB|nr:DUF308 domain-containing protein [Rhodovulum visakhapatnamense]MBL3570200.1 DUF308 domain-containing protein [Rhodovulum visakhapatnamense]MBL3577599.1 DUF308 domain-containing protein [Rhodovulum visakhapatnamense]OLS43498.1 hypothetical protein BV509_03600 [Rhodovulum sulfidophilum]TDX24242.1 uncharacterized membrane protein HdeD (DUF308 family) [Rhodovulum visakhapatnamense]